ncbi:conserved hypothetical protein [Candidatus Desulfarcum epimagneticum]|uniref:Nudix hydrolase domain-containing protein n=1 Tax=uncultured Desulfobacteraceae bacterium TaxID=218296 RepID=A0A484HI69_9BACT|nr:conserved hypothetical protein [uncultured Desulfobacteraceae bacterium]
MSREKKTPAAPRAAATTIFVREKQGKLQTYLLKRNEKSGFMAGKYVFPGGGLDPEDRDSDFWLRRLDMPPEKISERFGGDLSPGEAVAYCVAAVRENFEEAGAFRGSLGALAGDWEALEKARMSGGLSRGWLKKRAAPLSGLPDLSPLFRWSRWITPERMPRRYDTRFFITLVSGDETFSPDLNEAVRGIWIEPENGLSGNLNGDIPLSPPTLLTLHELLSFPSIHELKTAMADRTWGEPILPRLVVSEGGSVILMPWDDMYQDKKEAIETSASRHETLPFGEKISRVRNYDNVWKPVNTL